LALSASYRVVRLTSRVRLTGFNTGSTFSTQAPRMASQLGRYVNEAGSGFLLSPTPHTLAHWASMTSRVYAKYTMFLSLEKI
jgi:hypothetical protein